jgi:hypothetical protein
VKIVLKKGQCKSRRRGGGIYGGKPEQWGMGQLDVPNLWLTPLPVVSNNYSYEKMKMRIKVEASGGLSDKLISIGRSFSA